MHVLVPEYPGYGCAPGTPYETSVNHNVEAAYDFAINGLGWTPKKVIFFGRSIGTGPAVRMASEFDCGGVVLVSPYSSVKEMVGLPHSRHAPVRMCELDMPASAPFYLSMLDRACTASHILVGAYAFRPNINPIPARVSFQVTEHAGFVTALLTAELLNMFPNADLIPSAKYQNFPLQPATLPLVCPPPMQARPNAGMLPSAECLPDAPPLFSDPPVLHQFAYTVSCPDVQL